MKTLFIPAKSLVPITEVIKKVKLNGKIGLVSSIQFLSQLSEAKKLIKNSVICGQVIGCDASCIKSQDVDVILYIGSGTFHPIRIALETNKPVYIANPNTNEFSRLDNSLIESYKKNIKGKQIKYLNSEKRGILISIKPGQYDKEALNFKGYKFLFDTLNISELENFRDIECWVNTACPRIEGKNVINLEDLPEEK